MTKKDLVRYVRRFETIATEAAKAEGIVEAVLEGITTALAKGEKVELRGFGTFKVKESKPRTGRNPKTGEEIQIPAKKVVKFTPAKELKARIQE